jgi:molecular chaperone DnaK (HSP70)
VSDRAEILLNDHGNRTTPSCAAFTDSGLVIGDGAAQKQQLSKNSRNTCATNPQNFCRESGILDSKDVQVGMPFVQALICCADMSSIDFRFHSRSTANSNKHRM